MKRLFLIPLLALALSACSSLPAIAPHEPPEAGSAARCAEVFPDRPWRMVHAIQTDFKGGRKAVMMGVVSLSPTDNRVECALLSIEGLRLFEARDDDGTLTVRRALPPFDRPALAEGMMRDIRLLFFPPGVPPMATGRLPNGMPVCRYKLADGYEDIVVSTIDEVVIQRYDGRGRLTRRAAIERCHPQGAPGGEAVACRIRLEALRPARYHLDLDLVEARPAPGKPPKGP